MKMRIFIALGAVVSLAACGTPGAPRPPSLRLPQTVSDLVATRVDSTVTLTWTEPQRTTDGENIRALGPTLICMGVNDFPMTHCNEQVADLSQAQYASCAPKVGQAVTCAVTLAKDVQTKNPLGVATYAVEVLNTNGRSAGLSNQVRVPTAITIAAPDTPKAKVSADQITITATGTQHLSQPEGTEFQFHLFRREQGGQAEIDLGVPAQYENAGAGYFLEFVDRTFEWGKTYIYRVVGITTVTLPDGNQQQVQGEPSPEVTVTAHDVFPPAVPTGLQAVASGVGQPPFIDLTWAPNTESDLAGYNVYRHEEGQAPVKVNAELVKAPAYRDEHVERGHKYVYAVTAVDLRGNESGKSVEGSETVR
ncbi:MAG: fibronectin type III domain-containing protein [Terriglobales bacterium]